ncbi:MAG: peptidoglycan-binding protein [Candidatus Kaiserbacteria bacterium]|nr:peptidoglycan-binding protein [Candidatus Kaiserbacteria bacterium]
MSPRQLNRRNNLACAALLLLFLTSASSAHASQTSGTIDSTYKYAWSNVAGHVNFAPTTGGLTITDSAITGYAWSANTGWINFNATQSHVTNDGAGNLGGYAWDSGAGWVSFTGVTINSSGRFHGTATGGTVNGASYAINFNCTNCDVRTDWRPASARTTTTTTTSTPAPSVSSGGGGGGGGGSASFSGPSSSDKLLRLTIVPSTSSLPISGGMVTYTYHVANTGASYGAISNIVVADTVCSPVKYISGDDNGDARIDIKEVWTYGCTANLSQTTRNIANVTGYASASLNAFTISQNTTVIVGALAVVIPPLRAATAPSASVPSSQPYTRNLALRFTGNDVKQLQQFLNTHGFVIASAGIGSPGNETSYFGPATQAALAKFQAANDIMPAVGYFGPVTRAFVENMNETAKAAATPPQKTIPAPSTPVPVSTTTIFTRDLDWHMTGADVMDLQAFLIKQNTGPAARDLIAIEETGYFGTLTRKALAEFQAANGITPAAGYFGPKTKEFITRVQ